MADKHWDTLYEYCGDGQGIPGLPHLLTRKQASMLGVVQEFDEAIKAGAYKEALKPAQEPADKPTEKEEAQDG